MPSPVPVDFLLNSSRESKRMLMLSRLNHAAELRKRMDELEKERSVLEAEYLDEMEAAGLARLLIEDERLSGIGGHPIQKKLDFRDAGSVEGPGPLRAVQGYKRYSAAD